MMTNNTDDLEIETAALVHGTTRRVKLHGYAAARQVFNVDDDHRARIQHTAKDWSSWFCGLWTTSRTSPPPPSDDTPEVEHR